MANNLEGGGKTPLLRPAVLQAMGFKLVAYPLSLLGVSVRAMEGALEALRQGTILPPPQLPSFKASVLDAVISRHPFCRVAGVVYMIKFGQMDLGPNEIEHTLWH